MTLIDTNVILDILTNDAVWLGWSVQHLQGCRQTGTLHINEISYAELAVQHATEADLQRSLTALGIELDRAPTSALFLAAKAFRRYRSAGGSRTSVPADFLIGAHAQVSGMPILTRDARRFRAYFPGVKLITP
jgi:predicted nucleic acid-binding protein